MRRLTVVLLCAMAVLTVAGGAYGASKINGKSIKASTITGKQVKNHSLTRADFKGSVRGPQGVQGAQGPQGAQGLAGPAGPSGVTSIVAAQGDGIGAAFAACPGGTHPVSGGGLEEGDGYLWVSGMAINDAGQPGWVVAGNDASPVTAFAYCSAGVSRITLPNGTAARSPMLRMSDVRARAARR